jgi:ribosomal protein S18 acetylase RimI-like enzyme
MLIRPVTAAEHDALGRITLEAYRGIDGHEPSEYYSAKLLDVAARAREALVLVAVEGDELLGGVTYMGDVESSFAEFDDPDEACFRMLAVRPDRQGHGAGAALIEACIAQARADGKRALTLYSTPAMKAAHRLYERLGFRREEARDMIVESGVQLRSFVLVLKPEEVLR